MRAMGEQSLCEAEDEGRRSAPCLRCHLRALGHSHDDVVAASESCGTPPTRIGVGQEVPEGIHEVEHEKLKGLLRVSHLGIRDIVAEEVVD